MLCVVCIIQALDEVSSGKAANFGELLFVWGGLTPSPAGPRGPPRPGRGPGRTGATTPPPPTWHKVPGRDPGVDALVCMLVPVPLTPELLFPL